MRRRGWRSRSETANRGGAPRSARPGRGGGVGKGGPVPPRSPDRVRSDSSQRLRADGLNRLEGLTGTPQVCVGPRPAVHKLGPCFEIKEPERLYDLPRPIAEDGEVAGQLLGDPRMFLDVETVLRGARLDGGVGRQEPRLGAYGIRRGSGGRRAAAAG